MPQQMLWLAIEVPSIVLQLRIKGRSSIGRSLDGSCPASSPGYFDTRRSVPRRGSNGWSLCILKRHSGYITLMSHKRHGVFDHSPLATWLIKPQAIRLFFSLFSASPVQPSLLALYGGNPPATVRMVSNSERIFILWRHKKCDLPSSSSSSSSPPPPPPHCSQLEGQVSCM